MEIHFRSQCDRYLFTVHYLEYSYENLSEYYYYPKWVIMSSGQKRKESCDFIYVITCTCLRGISSLVIISAAFSAT